jgi:hypothetical protein
VDFEMVMYYQTSQKTLDPIPINGSTTYSQFVYNLAAGKFVAGFSSHGTENSNPWGSFGVNFGTIEVGEKARTYLWLPTTNSTVNGLPLGLERYTGEQSFDLVVVNNQAKHTFGTIPYPWGGSYSMTLQGGITNFLVPREQFLDSDFGAALLEGKAIPYNSSGPTPPLVGWSSALSLLSSYGPGNAYYELAGYWQNRAINPSSGGGNFSGESGTASTSFLSVNVSAVTTPPSNNTGGLPSNPGLLNASNANAPTAAIQSVITVNLTSNATLDLLLGGLLDNSTNGVNGTFQSITSQVPFMGFDAPVVSALANAIVPSDGLGVSPVSQYPPPPPPPNSNPLAGFVNAVSSVASTVSGAVVSFANLVWTTAVAAAVFVDQLAREAAELGGQLLARAAAALVSVGKLILSALQQFLNWLLSRIAGLIVSAFAPVVNELHSFTNGVGSNLEVGATDLAEGKSIVQAAGWFWANFSGPIFIIATIAAIALTVALTLLEAFSVGAGFVIPIIVGLVVSGAEATAAEGGGPSELGRFAGVGPFSPQVVAGIKGFTGWTTNSTGTAASYLGALSPYLGVATTSWAGAEVLDAWETHTIPEWTDEASAALGIIAILSAGAAYYYSEEAATVASVFFDVASVILDGIAINEEGWTLENVVITLIDGATGVGDIYAATQGK